MWLRRIYEFSCVHSNPIWKSRNCRDYRPSHLTFREYFRPFWFSRSRVVVACFNRACAVQMHKALSVRCQGCAKNKNIMLRCIVIGACAVQFLHYVPLYRNTQHYATLYCSIKRVYAPEAYKSYFLVLQYKCCEFAVKRRQHHLWNYNTLSVE